MSSWIGRNSKIGKKLYRQRRVLRQKSRKKFIAVTDENDPNTWGFENYEPPPSSINGVVFERNGNVEGRLHWGTWIPERKRWGISSCDGEMWSWNSDKSVWEVDDYLYSIEWHQQFPDSYKQTFAQRCELYK